MPQSDPIIPDRSNPQSLNRYSYVVSNPVSMTDPTGMAYQWLHFSAKSNIKGAGRYVERFPNADRTVEQTVDAWFIFNLPCCSVVNSWLTYTTRETNLCCLYYPTVELQCSIVLVCYPIGGGITKVDFTWKPWITVAQGANSFTQSVQWNYTSYVGGNTWARWEFKVASSTSYSAKYTFGAQNWANLLSKEARVTIDKGVCYSRCAVTTERRNG